MFASSLYGGCQCPRPATAIEDDGGFPRAVKCEPWSHGGPAPDCQADGRYSAAGWGMLSARTFRKSPTWMAGGWCFNLLLLSATAISATPTTLRAQCTGLCGDVNSNGQLTTRDLIELLPYVSTADPGAADLQCADVDNYLGVTLRDWVYLQWELFFGWPLDCDIANGKFVPAANPAYRLHYNSVLPADDSLVTLYIDATFQNLTQAVALVLSVNVNGEIPIFSEVGPNTLSESGWETISFAGSGTGGIPPGHLMGLFSSIDFAAAFPGRHTLGKATLIIAPVGYARTITLNLVELPTGSNMTMAHDGVFSDTDVWGLNLDPWIVDLTGDVNNDRVITASDIIGLINYVFKGGRSPYPHGASGDVNCSGDDTSSDVIGLVNYVFKSGLAPCDVAAECTLTINSWSCP